MDLERLIMDLEQLIMLLEPLIMLMEPILTNQISKRKRICLKILIGDYIF